MVKKEYTVSKQFSECTIPLDFELVSYDSVVAFRPLTERAKEFLRDRVDAQAWQFLGDALVVDARPASDLVMGLLDEGLNFHWM